MRQPTRTFQLSLESDTRLITLREKDLKLEAKGIKTAYLNPINLEEDSVGNWIRNEFIFSVAEGQFQQHNSHLGKYLRILIFKLQLPFNTTKIFISFPCLLVHRRKCLKDSVPFQGSRGSSFDVDLNNREPFGKLNRNSLSFLSINSVDRLFRFLFRSTYISAVFSFIPCSLFFQYSFS